MPRKKSKFKIEYRTLSIPRDLAEKAEKMIRDGKLGYKNLPDLLNDLIRHWLKEKGYLK